MSTISACLRIHSSFSSLVCATCVYSLMMYSSRFWFSVSPVSVSSSLSSDSELSSSPSEDVCPDSCVQYSEATAAPPSPVTVVAASHRGQ